ncbi:MAG: hypothetical protein K0R59_2754 [Sphingobacterium sp.]|jgi:hypothetical protein|nr:hypothetical protein [Sphingobacterium sp.]
MKNLILHALRCCALFSFLITFISYAQNSKSSASKQNSGNRKNSENQVDIYVAGSCYNENTRLHTAVYWKNGKPVVLTDGQSDAEATSMTVVGNDIYVAGNVGGQATYWKNGHETRIRKDEGDYNTAYSITVKNGDVYVAGYYRDYNEFKTGYKDLAMYWKNGQPVTLPVPKFYNPVTGQSFDEIYSCATFITAVDDDIYTIGNGSSPYIQIYWKNGNILETINELKYVSTIRQLNGNAYAVGKTHSGQPAYWKNGIIESLSSKDGVANCIAISGSDVYIAGVDDSNGNGTIEDYDVGKYWKNGQLLANLEGTYNNEKYIIYRPTSIAVSGNDVYIVGNALIGHSTYGRRLLKNGQILGLSVVEGYSWSMANFVTSNVRGEDQITKRNKVNPDNENDLLIDNANEPQIIEPKNYTVFNHFPRTTRIEWTPIAKATEYEITMEIDQTPGNGHKSFDKATIFGPYFVHKTPLTAISFKGAGAQVHRYKIQAKNKDKIISTTDWFFMDYLQ